ncbi:thiamine pyrophosphate-dependent enzyme [Clostridium tagluense]|uniref:thiamine pyrophosphate-dependent enzyme n=1 Tax=Clostridium tagluense TaxID=360422 RepID=UPI001CF47FD5|nr:thiamine pyrophosphate-dependent enzyme [Clostridium tagluense]MCB2296792.1 thiamine pyrophosphate-dependent enzyme [Clostridium tagluense]
MEDISKELRNISLRLSHKCKDGNLQSVFSCLEILWTLYDKIMNWSPELATDDNRDFFLISKGQATLALFPVLIKKGLFKEEELKEIGSFNSKFCIQTDITKFNGGVENSAGSLGHGLPMATGIAMANKIKKSPSRVFVLTGDGEFNEGTMWEACIFAAGKKLDNLCIIIDDNNSVGAMIDMGDMKKKLDSFGLDVYEVNGHNLDELHEVLSKKPKSGCPMAVIAHTVRGYGSKTMMAESIWFHKAPNDQELEILTKEVDKF